MAYRESSNDWTVSQDSAANTAQTPTKAAETGNRHWITGIEVTISAAASGAVVGIELRSAAVRKWRKVIATAAPIGTTYSIDFARAIPLVVGDAANLVIDAGGASCVTIANMRGYTLKG